MKKSFLALETKLKCTYDLLPEIFLEIAKGLKQNIRELFENASLQMRKKSAKEAWIQAIELSKTSMNKEDLEVLKGFGKLLGKTEHLSTMLVIVLLSRFIIL